MLNQPHPTTVHNFETEILDQQLDVNLENFTEVEILTAIKRLKNNKAHGIDEVNAEMLKNGGDCLIRQLTRLLNECWKQQAVPDEWRKGIIVKLLKKGDLSNCNNWRGVTVLSVLGKVLSIALLNRLKDTVDLKLREEQAGFRRGRSCSEQIFTL